MKEQKGKRKERETERGGEVPYWHFFYSTSTPGSFRVTTHLENLVKSGNTKVVREKSGEVKSAEIWFFA